VIRAMFVSGFLKVKQCVIKEGRKDMLVDVYGRGMRERIAWQAELYEDLKNVIPMPKVYETFQVDEDIYLVTEFIKGEALENIIAKIYNGNCYEDLAKSARLKLISYSLKICEIISKLHEQGYVHRDVTPTNFLIDKRERVVPIDMEIAYSIKNNKPQSPF